MLSRRINASSLNHVSYEGGILIDFQRLPITQSSFREIALTDGFHRSGLVINSLWFYFDRVRREQRSERIDVVDLERVPNYLFIRDRIVAGRSDRFRR